MQSVLLLGSEIAPKGLTLTPAHVPGERRGTEAFRGGVQWKEGGHLPTFCAED